MGGRSEINSIVVRPLRKFIYEQGTLVGPLNGPDALVEAMRDFLPSMAICTPRILAEVHNNVQSFVSR